MTGNLPVADISLRTRCQHWIRCGRITWLIAWIPRSRSIHLVIRFLGSSIIDCQFNNQARYAEQRNDCHDINQAAKSLSRLPHFLPITIG